MTPETSDLNIFFFKNKTFFLMGFYFEEVMESEEYKIF